MTGTVVVTGAAGFIGTHLTMALAQNGLRVAASDLKAEPRAFSGVAGIDYHQGEFQDSPALHDALRSTDQVFHLASKHLEVGVPDEEFRRVNVVALERFARLCDSADVSTFIYASSVGVYGHVSHPPADEEAPKSPQNIYEVTKLEAEEILQRLVPEVGMKIVIVRPSWVFGQGCPRTSKLLRSLRRRRFFYVGRGDNLRHPVYIEDAVRGFVAAADSPGTESGRAYNIAGPEWMTLSDMVSRTSRALGVAPPFLHLPRGLALALFSTIERLFRFAGKQPPVSRRSLAFFENDNAFAIDRARRELGYEPRVGLEEGMTRVASS